MPSVVAALALARSLGTTVEELFGPIAVSAEEEVWAWKPTTGNSLHWSAEVGGKIVCFPAESMPMLTELPDRPATSNRPAAEGE